LLVHGPGILSRVIGIGVAGRSGWLRWLRWTGCDRRCSITRVVEYHSHMTAVRAAALLVVGLLAALYSPVQATTPTPIPRLDECNPSSPECPAGTECYCCCGAFRCLPPGVPCCALACVFPTPLPTAPATPVPPPGACVGDCSGDGAVTIDELMLGVNIALGNTDLSACPLLQCDENVAGVFVNCLLIAVNNALYRCSQATQTPTATNTPRPPPVLPHGHTCCECENAACTEFSWVEVEPACPPGCRMFMDAECEAPCQGGPHGGPASCVPLTPCTADADCDDGNGCTIDRCTLNGCTHDCVCV